jgi:hypothetical protein
MEKKTAEENIPISTATIPVQAALFDAIAECEVISLNKLQFVRKDVAVKIMSKYSNQKLAEFKEKLKDAIATKAMNGDPIFRVGYLDVTILIDSIT